MRTIFTPQIFAGLRDTVSDSQGSGPRQCRAGQARRGTGASARPVCARRYALLERATDQATAIAAALANEEDELKGWAQTLQRNCEEHLEDMLFLAPWLALPTPSRSRRRRGRCQLLRPGCEADEASLHVGGCQARGEARPTRPGADLAGGRDASINRSVR